ncbi:probable cytochrome P450 6a13 [Teleopsis dalmanni]|uniref:probable cytochrome P450 6a13 n=1 Tax=Teleopsis dalmanni TaxID=139649 RepID=UPI0018CF68D4|nr:probable cytochrome P450 6a13 [Teleopsis dalmanni]
MTLLILLLTLIATFYVWLKRYYAYWRIKNIPHEQPKLFMGNMTGIGRTHHWKDINQRIYKQFKGTAPFVGFYTFMSKAAFILDLDLIKHILVKDFSNFTDRGFFHNERDDPLTANLLFLDGEPWRALRHKLSPVFTTGKIKYMFSTMVTVAENLEGACHKIVDKKEGQFDAKDLFARYTTDMIGSCAFGLECHSLTNPNSDFQRMGRKILEEPRHSPFVQAFMFTAPDLARKLRMKTFTDEATEFFLKVVQETVEYREKNNIKRNDFIDLLIELKTHRDLLGEDAIPDDQSNGFTLKQLAAQALIFFLAGFDTSSSTMAFCIYELAINPQIQELLRNEIFDVLEKYNEKLCYECIKEMYYLEKVISETLRKYPVLPHIARRTLANYNVPNTNFTFEKNLRVIIPVDSIHHDPELYPVPEKFDPERFSQEQIAKRHPAAYLPFGDGPRNCIGKRFGTLQVQIGIIVLLKSFRISITEHTEIPARYSLKGFLLTPTAGMKLKFEKL